MKEINKQELEKIVETLISGKITKVEMAKQLRTDVRTLTNKIYELDNKVLLEKYIEKFPYKPGENKNIDYEALVIELLQAQGKVMEIQEKYHIAERTYRRNIEKLKNSNPQIYKLYKSYISGELTEKEENYVRNLKPRKVSYTNSTEYRKAELLDFFTTYEELLKKGLSEKEAQKELKTNSKEIKRKNDEFDKIKEQEKIKNKNNMYKQSLAVKKENLIRKDNKKIRKIEGTLEREF